MKHFDIAEWADFARGLADPGRSETMGRHLAAGCDKCRRPSSVLARAAAVAREESRYAVPDYVVHCARAIYALARPERVRLMPRVTARLVFDSFLQPQPEGVRAQHRLSRQMLYEAGGYVVDLRQEHEQGSGRIIMVGQIASRRPGLATAGVPVKLGSGSAVVARSVSNEFGEFQLEYQAQRGLRLDIGEPGGRRGRPQRPGTQGGLD